MKPATLEEIKADFERTASWVACNSYRVEHEGTTYLLLNDAFDGSGSELAICRVLAGGEGLYMVEQLESLTICWVEPERIPAAIVKCIEHPVWVSTPFVVKCDDWQDHHCRLCA